MRHRPLDNSFSYITSREANDAFYSDSQFVGLGFSTTVSGSDMRVLQVFEGSPAAEAGLGRGHRILEINGRTIEALVAASQLDDAFGPNQIGAEVEVAFQTRDGETRRRRLTKRAVTIPTVSLTRVITVDGRRVGYVFFRNFVRPSFAALDAAFATLREANVSELVLDLRYNGGGLVDVAVHLASLIAGPVTNGQVLAKYVHNDKYRSFDEDIRFETPEKALGLSRLFVVTTRGSASASELMINVAQTVHSSGGRRRPHLRQAGRTVLNRRSATRSSRLWRSRFATSPTRATTSTAFRPTARPAMTSRTILGT